MSIGDPREWMARAREGMQLDTCACGGAIRAPGHTTAEGGTVRDVYTPGHNAVTFYLGRCDDCHVDYAWPNGRDQSDTRPGARSADSQLQPQQQRAL